MLHKLGGHVHISEIVKEVRLEWELGKIEHEKWGITLWMQREGYACYNEMLAFYESDKWKLAAANDRKEWNYTCKKCNKKDGVMHVHHHFPIMTIYSEYAERNFDEWRLSTYCQKCHEWFHANSVRSDYGYEMASKEEVKAEKEYFRKWRIAHDTMRECRFCYG